MFNNSSYLLLDYNNSNLGITTKTNPNTGVKIQQAQLAWISNNASTTLPFCSFIQVVNAPSNSQIIMPVETQSSSSTSCIIYNSSANPVTILSSGGNTITVINPTPSNYQTQPTNAYLFVLVNNAQTTAQSWVCLPLGSMSSSALVNSFIGSNSGLAVNSTNQLQINLPILSYTTSVTQSLTDANQLIVIGTPTSQDNLTYTLLPAASTSNGFFFTVKNGMTLTPYTVTVQTQNTDTIDNSQQNSIVLAQDESTMFVSNGSNMYYSLASLTSAVVNSPNVVQIGANQTSVYVNSNQANCISQVFTGGNPAVSSVNIYLPAQVSYLWIISNYSTNSLNLFLNLQNLPSNQPTIPQNQTMIVFSDGATIQEVVNPTFNSLSVSGTSILNGDVQVAGSLASNTGDLKVVVPTNNYLNITQGNLAVSMGDVVGQGNFTIQNPSTPNSSVINAQPNAFVNIDIATPFTATPQPVISSTGYAPTLSLTGCLNPSSLIQTWPSILLKISSTNPPTTSTIVSAAICMDAQGNIFFGNTSASLQGNGNYNINPLLLNYGGTGATNAIDACTNILPSVITPSLSTGAVPVYIYNSNIGEGNWQLALPPTASSGGLQAGNYFLGITINNGGATISKVAYMPAPALPTPTPGVSYSFDTLVTYNQSGSSDFGLLDPMKIIDDPNPEAGNNYVLEWTYHTGGANNTDMTSGWWMRPESEFTITTPSLIKKLNAGELDEFIDIVYEKIIEKINKSIKEN